MNLINTCRNISLHSEEILFNWQQEILYRFAIDWRCPFLDAIASEELGESESGTSLKGLV